MREISIAMFEYPYTPLWANGESLITVIGDGTASQYKGVVQMCSGYAKGANAICDAQEKATRSLRVKSWSIKEAKGVLINFQIHSDYPLTRIQNELKRISNSCDYDDDADVICGMTFDGTLEPDEAIVTLLVIGMEQK
ncbi:hypothetical protein AGMMS50229_18800 [Campylobacterota bacterium]|nr:hypothetical protein AGMMS50229_18800 [Campylobacterota bacterium]